MTDEDFDSEPVVAFLTSALGEDTNFVLVTWPAAATEKVDARAIGNCESLEAAAVLGEVAVKMTPAGSEN